MNFFGYGIPIGRYFGINVRLHITFLWVIWSAIQNSSDVVMSLLFVASMYFCILLHEFGHALAARWCDGEANDILLWPLGGLAFVRPAFNATAHLITTVAGPLVTLILWLTLTPIATGLKHAGGDLYAVGAFFSTLARYNRLLLVFNLIPAFPMDGGRILRDSLWHWIDVEKATRIAVNISRACALVAVGLVFTPPEYWRELAHEHALPGILLDIPLLIAGDMYFLLLALFIFLQSGAEQQMIAAEGLHEQSFSIRERIQRGHKQRAFREAVRERASVEADVAFHKCASCGVTEAQSPTMDFRVCSECSNGQEYCRDHLDAHTHS